MNLLISKTKSALSFLVIVLCLMFSACKKEQGPAGAKSLLSLVPIPAGNDCANGGIKIETGVDINGNNILETSEINESQSVCNGIAGTNGYTSLTRISNFSSNAICEAGGIEIQAGLDSNFNGVLDDGEVQQTQQICNGVNGGYDKQVAILLMPGYSGVGISQITPYIYETPIVDFNINNYTGIDSAVFYVVNANVNNVGNTLNFKLYNVTDNAPFEQSFIYTNSLQPVNLTSQNLITYFPNKSVRLGIQAYVSKEGQYGVGTYFYLMLYRK